MDFYLVLNVPAARFAVEAQLVSKMTVPPADVVAKKWGEVTPGRSGYYQTNTPAAAATWESEAQAAAGNFKAAVSAADIDKRFRGGIRKAGAAKFSRKVTEVGVGRFGPGVSAAVGDMQTGVDPYLATIAATEIPARGPRGDPANYAIVAKVGDPLHKKRLALLAAG